MKKPKWVITQIEAVDLLDAMLHVAKDKATKSGKVELTGLRGVVCVFDPRTKLLGWLDFDGKHISLKEALDIVAVTKPEPVIDDEEASPTPP